MASHETVRILDGNDEVARHPRSWDKGQQVEDEAHLAALVAAKRSATKERGQNRLRVAVPSSALLLKEAGERGHSLRSVVRALQRLLNEYGASELELACILEGEDHESYGERLFDSLANSLKQRQVKSCDRRQLYRYHDFFKCYPQIVGTVSPLLRVPAEMLVSRLSYSHFELLLNLDDPLQRAFYEVECLRGGWSVRELKRQIGSVSYERTALSKDKEALNQHIGSLAETDKPELRLRDPVVFEFLGIRPQDTMLEPDLEHALLDKLEPFLLEPGRGFCFEARQKRILIGGEYFFIDLVFYHRLLKCHVWWNSKPSPLLMRTSASSIPI